jgi:hypothetical protein
MKRMTRSPLIARALDVAEKYLGRTELSRRMGVSDAIIQAWRGGYLGMSNSDFLRLIDIITSLDVRWEEWNP